MRSSVVLWSLFIQHIASQQFLSRTLPTDLQQILISDGTLYVGGTNEMYKLDSRSLVLQRTVNTGCPKNPSSCMASIPCPAPPDNRNNEVKALAPFSQDAFIACGSQYGHCEVRRYSDLTLVSSSEACKVSNRAGSSFMLYTALSNFTTSIDALWVATSKGADDLMAVATRSKDNFNLLNSDAGSIFLTPTVSGLKYLSYDPLAIRYIHGFAEKNFRYFLKTKPGNDPRSTIGSVCHNDKSFISYMEIPLQCKSGDVTRDSMQAAVVGAAGVLLAAKLSAREGRRIDAGDKILYAVFGARIDSTATFLCAFPLSTVMERQQQTFVACHKYANTTAVEAGPVEFVGSPQAPCRSRNYPDSDSKPYCEIPTDGTWTTPLNSKILITQESLLNLGFAVNGIAVVVSENYTIAVLSDPSGKIQKVLMANASTLLPAGRFASVDLNTTSLQPAKLEISSDGFIFAISKRQVFQVPLQQCQLARSCSECQALKDPFCGWCTLEQRCSTKQQCNDSHQPDYWLQSDCMTVTGFEQSTISLESTTPLNIYMSIIPLQLPSRPNDQFSCSFVLNGQQPINTSAERRVSDAGKFLTCRTPDADDITSSILASTDSVSYTLILSLGGRPLVSIRDLTFYDCRRNTSCTSCTSSRFPCTWCLESQRCSSQSCNGEAAVVSNGGLSCPRFDAAPLSEFLVASGTAPSIRVKLLYLQSNAKVFACDLVWNSGNVSYSAILSGESLTCNSRNLSFSDNLPDVVAELRIGFRSADSIVYLDNPGNATVRVYKCEQMQKTCGECVAIDPTFNCSWCGGRCQFKSECDPDEKIFDSNQNCPNMEITSIAPLNGPVQGGTLITIKGVNLGKSIAEVRVTIGDNICAVNSSLSTVPSLVVCQTSPGAENYHSSVRVNRSDASALSRLPFTYLIPTPVDLTPKRGPVSGGTMLTISGPSVNIGSSKSIVFAAGDLNLPCDLKGESSKDKLVCVTRNAGSPRQISINLRIDDYMYSAYELLEYIYVNDSTITSIIPLKGIVEGGTAITVTGTDLDIIAEPKVYLEPSTSRNKRAIGRRAATSVRYYGACDVTNSTMMNCLLPSIPASEWNQTGISYPLRYNYGFLLDNITSVWDLSNRSGFGPLEIFLNPTFKYFGTFAYPADSSKPVQLSIDGENILSIGNEQLVTPMIKVLLNNHLPCEVKLVTDKLVICVLPDIEPGAIHMTTVQFGNSLKVEVGEVVNKSTEILPSWLIGAIAGSVVFLVLIIIIVIIIVFKRRERDKDRDNKYLQGQLDSLEMRVAKECKEAFTELQTDMTEITSDVANLHGLPFFDYQKYCMKFLFPMHTDHEHPVVRKLEIVDRSNMVEKGLHNFSRLLLNKTFLLIFVRTIEQQPKFQMKHRVEVASLLSVALQGKMEYQTDILKTLLSELIERSMGGKNHPRLLLRRAESVAEKMLSNWFTFLLHKFLKECAGEHLYLLFRAIKQQVDKGPVDAVTADAKYSLSEDKLLRQHIDCNVLTLKLLSPDQHAPFQDPQTIKVLDCDTISQALEKILDTLYRNVPYSTNCKTLKESLTLEWIKSNQERVAMSDDDPQYSKMEGELKPLVKLAHYKLPDNASVALTPKHPMNDHGPSKSSLPKSDSGMNGHHFGSLSGASLSRANSSNNILDGTKDRKIHRYHLIKPHDVEAQQDGERNKMVSEIYLTRLLATKGTLQQFVDDLFETVFSTAHRGSALPLAIKYMFDFLDDQALMHNIREPDVIHSWKSNSLPLRFWVSVIKNPDFVFDIHKSDIVDACLAVVAQIFMDSCSQSDHRLGITSPSTKLLYAKDIPKYKKWVERYYQDIKSMPAISDSDMNAILAEESRQHEKEFNTSAAWFELYTYVNCYYKEIVAALEEDEFAKKDALSKKLETVHQQLSLTSKRLP